MEITGIHSYTRAVQYGVETELNEAGWRYRPVIGYRLPRGDLAYEVLSEVCGTKERALGLAYAAAWRIARQETDYVRHQSA